MSHVDQQIREKVKTLITGLTTTGARVYTRRVYPHGPGHIPGLNLVTGDATQLEAFGLATMERWELPLIVEGRTKPDNADSIDDILDDITAEVTAATIQSPPTLDNLVEWFKLERTSKSSTGSLERPTGIVRMEFLARYVRAASDAETLPFAP